MYKILTNRFLLFFPERYLDAVERALSAGDVVLIENLEETLDPVLGPLLGRETIKKGRYESQNYFHCESQGCVFSLCIVVAPTHMCLFLRFITLKFSLITQFLILIPILPISVSCGFIMRYNDRLVYYNYDFHLYHMQSL